MISSEELRQRIEYDVTFQTMAVMLLSDAPDDSFDHLMAISDKMWPDVYEYLVTKYTDKELRKTLNIIQDFSEKVATICMMSVEELNLGEVNAGE